MSISVVSAPLRISFLGGGSDYKNFFSLGHTGYTFGASINLSVYLSGIFHSRLTDYPYKLTYRITDAVDNYESFKHPVAKHAFQIADWKNQGVHISTMADVPAGTGLGSSSSFTVGLLHLLRYMQGENSNPDWLASNAVKIERELLKEAGGLQDQYFAAFGGVRLFEFKANGVQSAAEVPFTYYESLSNSLVLVPVGVARNSSLHAEMTAKSVAARETTFIEMAMLAKDTFTEFLAAKGADSGVEIVGRALTYAWNLKKIISGQPQNEKIDELIRKGFAAGAIGGKLCGAGGSGFILFIVEPDNRKKFISHFEFEDAQEISISGEGSQCYKLEKV